MRAQTFYALFLGVAILRQALSLGNPKRQPRTSQNRSSLPHASGHLKNAIPKILLWAVIASCLVATRVHAESRQLSADVRQFLQTYCASCHGAEEQKGERRFDTLAPQIDSDNALVDYQDIVDLLNLGDMPPSEAKQPSDAQRQQVIEFLSLSIREYHETRQGKEVSTRLRRLNAREYRNTIRDLLNLDMTMFDPTVGFPSDQTTEHLDNNGETLVTSSFLLAKYLESAEVIVEKAFGSLKKPEVQTWSFTYNFRQQPEIDQVHRRTNGFTHLTLYDVTGADKHEGAYAAIEDFADGVPVDGLYEVRFQAEAMNRLHPYDDAFLDRDRNEPLRLGIVAGNRKAGKLYVPQPLEPLLAELELADESRWYTVRIPLDAGWTPRFTFRNGLMDARSLWTLIPRKYPQLFEEKVAPGIVQGRLQSIQHGQVPHIRIYEVEITGPFYDQWPTASQRAVLGNDFEAVAASGELPESTLRHHLQRFASRAFRRPLENDELERLVQLANRRLDEGRTRLQAYQDAIKLVLCSPNFIYLAEPVDDSKHLNASQLATRLSYFLWSTMPDSELRALAADDKLTDPRILEAQVERMLRDPKSDALINGLLDSWLTLRDLGSMPPDRRQFPEYYQHDLLAAMRQETFLFTRHLLENNLSVQNFLDSDFTFVNKPLAKLYGIEPPKSWKFERVSLPSGRRGGLLGQASVLTVTANGIDTSPVVRGVWLLDNLLGMPPSPPPPDVEPLDPDIRGAVTIREQLEKHRSSASCYECHRKIDPLGFALENFDPIGRWRDKYPRGGKIDAAGELPSGESFQNIAELKRCLLKQSSVVTRSLVNKLLAYAIGRRVRIADRPEVDSILHELRQHDEGFRHLVKQIVLSDTFRTK